MKEESIRGNGRTKAATENLLNYPEKRSGRGVTGKPAKRA